MIARTLGFLLLGIALRGSDLTEWRKQHELQILTEFADFLRIPNVDGDRPNIARNADFLQKAMERRGIRVEQWSVDGSSPVVFGELKAPGASQTLVFYAHYDGQPVDPKDWQGHAPFEPILRSGTQTIPWPKSGEPVNPEWRLYARSASDDKAPIIAMLAALDAMKALGRKPGANLKFVFEGEEEAGSRHLGAILDAHKDRLASDGWLICDGPVHQTRRPLVYFGARGVTGLELTVYGPARELHSGHYGNWAPNPAFRLAELIAGMKSPDGRVLVKGFYEGIAPLTPSERKAIAEEPALEDDLRRSLGLAQTDNAPRRLSDTLTEPSLNIRGLSSAATGTLSRNVIPATATASIDLRLVKGNDWRKMLDLVRQHIAAQGYFVTDVEPDMPTRLAHARIARITVSAGYNAVRTSMDLPFSQQVLEKLRRTNPDQVVLPTLGGSVPLSTIQAVLPVPLIGIPTVNHDNNQHSANENLRLADFWQGIETLGALLQWN